MAAAGQKMTCRMPSTSTGHWSHVTVTVLYRGSLLAVESLAKLLTIESKANAEQLGNLRKQGSFSLRSRNGFLWIGSSTAVRLHGLSVVVHSLRRLPK
jgi:hypothetical protein